MYVIKKVTQNTNIHKFSIGPFLICTVTNSAVLFITTPPFGAGEGDAMTHVALVVDAFPLKQLAGSGVKEGEIEGVLVGVVVLPGVTVLAGDGDDPFVGAGELEMATAGLGLETSEGPKLETGAGVPVGVSSSNPQLGRSGKGQNACNTRGFSSNTLPQLRGYFSSTVRSRELLYLTGFATTSPPVGILSTTSVTVPVVKLRMSVTFVYIWYVL
jgi:hypothetical protein